MLMIKKNTNPQCGMHNWNLARGGCRDMVEKAKMEPEGKAERRRVIVVDGQQALQKVR